MYSARDWVEAFKGTARGIDIAHAIIAEGFDREEIFRAFSDARYVVGFIGPDGSRFHVSDTPLSDIAVVIIGTNPWHHPGIILPKRLWLTS